MVSICDRVRYVETDMMGVVHHSNYFRWFEMGACGLAARCRRGAVGADERQHNFPYYSCRSQL